MKKKLNQTNKLNIFNNIRINNNNIINSSSIRYENVINAMEIFKKDAFVHQPNSKYLYTTHGFTVLSSIIEGIYYFCYYIYIEVTVTMNFVAGFIII